MDIKFLLIIIAAIESNSGSNLDHPVIRNPASIHYNQAAQGSFGLMPATIATLGSSDHKVAATRLIERIQRAAPNASICPYELLIKWEMGEHHKVTVRDIERGQKRKDRAIQEMRRIGITPQQYTNIIVNTCSKALL